VIYRVACDGSNDETKTAIYLNIMVRSRLIEEIASYVFTVTLRWFTTAACHGTSVCAIQLNDARSVSIES